MELFMLVFLWHIYCSSGQCCTSSLCMLCNVGRNVVHVSASLKRLLCAILCSNTDDLTWLGAQIHVRIHSRWLRSFSKSIMRRPSSQLMLISTCLGFMPVSAYIHMKFRMRMYAGISTSVLGILHHAQALMLIRRSAAWLWSYKRLARRLNILLVIKIWTCWVLFIGQKDTFLLKTCRYSRSSIYQAHHEQCWMSLYG